MSCRFGGVPAQFKAFWDSTGGLWQSGALNGKPFGLFTSNGTLGGGQVSPRFPFLAMDPKNCFKNCSPDVACWVQEVTLLGSLSNFIHHGMIYVPLVRLHPRSELWISTPDEPPNRKVCRGLIMTRVIVGLLVRPPTFLSGCRSGGESVGRRHLRR